MMVLFWYVPVQNMYKTYLEVDITCNKVTYLCVSVLLVCSSTECV